jgi:hypothetical protein
MHDLTLSNSLADLAARINAKHEAAGGALKRGLQHAIAAGELLLEAKAQLKHGQWLIQWDADDGWYVLRGSHGWLHGDIAHAFADAQEMANADAVAVGVRP